MQEILEQARGAFVEVFGCEPALVTIEATPEEIPGWDSLGHTNLVAALEKRFGVSFDIDEIMDMENVAAIVRIVATKREAQPD